jgi:glyoxylase-like metal-dependent hydrolase (beta-lactamase superfamily II)
VQTDFIAGQPVDVGSGGIAVQRILGRNAGPMTGPGTNTYLIGKQHLAIVDPGPADPQHIDRLLAIIGERRVEGIFVTHTHGDHSPGTALLQARLDTEIIGLAPPQGSGQDPSFRPTRLYRDGERIHCSEFTMTLLHTPGHVSNHLCFLLESEQMLFTGDHILEGTTPVILPPDGDMRHYLDSLEQLQQLPLRYLAPAHGSVMDNPAQVIETLRRHRLRRESKALRVLAQRSRESGSCTLQELAIGVYDDVPSHLLPWAERTLLAHLIKLEQDGAVYCTDARWQVTESTLND